MHNSLILAANALDALGRQVVDYTNDDRPLNELYGDYHSPLNRHEIAQFAFKLAAQINKNEIDDLSPELLQEINKITGKISGLQSSIHHLYDGNGNYFVSTYKTTLDWIAETIEPLYAWQTLKDKNLMPHNLLNRLKYLQAQLNILEPNTHKLEQDIKIINDARESAESLPTDLETLKDSQNKINKINNDAAILFDKINVNHKASDELSKKIEVKKEEADKLIERCEEAYHITTTKGLSASFENRAKQLANSMWVWVICLFVALAAGGWIGAVRFESFTTLMNTGNKTFSIIIMEFVISVLGIGAPIWFAWIATKQIGQRFRLAEDYAFKASVAKAYEGYRKEAARIDEAFEARLFSSALTRLEEAPLRLMEQDTHGSPWHELITSPQFQAAIDKIPELKEKFINIATDGMKLIKQAKQSSKAEKSNEEPEE